MEINAGGQHNRPRTEKRNYHLGFIFKPVSLHSSSSPYTEFFVALHNRIKLEELGPARLWPSKKKNLPGSFKLLSEIKATFLGGLAAIAVDSLKAEEGGEWTKEEAQNPRD